MKDQALNAKQANIKHKLTEIKSHTVHSPWPPIFWAPSSAS